MRAACNPAALDRADIVALGDSFTEGSKVGDDEAWPARLAVSSGMSVYNLGMSGTAPQYYRDCFKGFGLGLRPRIVVCSVYAGNDFRGKAVEPAEASLGGDISAYFSRSPLRLALRRTQVNVLGAINAGSTFQDADVLSWIPLAVPTGGATAPHYAFTPQKVLDLYATRDQVLAADGWRAATQPLRELAELCRQHGIRLMLLYSPTKPQVVLPLAKDNIPPDGLRRFCAYEEEDDLPPPEPFRDALLARVDVRERAFAQFCAQIGAEFVSPTAALRDAAAAATQVYFTYDQHWTAPGHAIVADAINRAIAQSPAPQPPAQRRAKR